MTAADAALLAALPAWAFAFVLVLARVGAAVMLLPGLGESGPPAMVRAGMAMGVTLLLLPLVQPLIPPVPGAFVPAAGMVMAEVATGLWLGWLARVLVLALPMAGQIVAYMIGLANVLEPDTSLGADSTALGRLFSLAAAVAVLASGLWAVPVAALAGSFRLIAPGALLPAGDSAAAASAAVAGGFALALRLAAPFVLAAIVWQVASGVVARLIPRLQVYFLTMPAQILGGLLLLALLSGAMLTAWQDAVQVGFDRLPGLG
ncbi:MAG TPA: flagellar biosynthetic protein FliR [Acetobacteraceae bacterium]|nr:flagellar biosynthetic protein FliR [Acetobacteraceae bacterium]